MCWMLFFFKLLKIIIKCMVIFVRICHGFQRGVNSKVLCSRLKFKYPTFYFSLICYQWQGFLNLQHFHCLWLKKINNVKSMWLHYKVISFYSIVPVRTLNNQYFHSLQDLILFDKAKISYRVFVTTFWLMIRTSPFIKYHFVLILDLCICNKYFSYIIGVVRKKTERLSSKTKILLWSKDV